MGSEKAWYWLTAGVVALGLNGAYQDGQLAWVHRLANQASSVIEQASARGEQLAAMAETFLPGNAGRLDHAMASIQRIDSKLSCQRVAQVQRQIALAQVRKQVAEAKLQVKMDLAQARIDRLRSLGIDGVMEARDCSGGSRMIVHVPAVPRIEIPNLPDIHIPDMPDIDISPSRSGNGPI